VRLLAAHDRSEQELRRRLSTRGASTGVIDATITRLQQLGYLDDRRFAHGAAEQAVRRGHGSERVRATLAAQGVADDLIDAAINAAFDDETALARQVLARRYPIAPQHPAERARAARYLLRRGFPEVIVLAIVGEGC